MHQRALAECPECIAHLPPSLPPETLTRALRTLRWHPSRLFRSSCHGQGSTPPIWVMLNNFQSLKFCAIPSPPPALCREPRPTSFSFPGGPPLALQFVQKSLPESPASQQSGCPRMQDPPVLLSSVLLGCSPPPGRGQPTCQCLGRSLVLSRSSVLKEGCLHSRV